MTRVVETLWPVAVTLVTQLNRNPETRCPLGNVGGRSTSWQLQGLNYRHGCRFNGGRTGQRSHVHQNIRQGGPYQVTRRFCGQRSFHSNDHTNSDGRPRRGAAELDGVVLLAAMRAKERRYPEFGEFD